MIELKPCPFCGSEAVCKYDSGNEVWNQSWQCKCSKCDVPTAKFFGSNSWARNKKEDASAERQAIEVWNQRAPVAQQEPGAWLYVCSKPGKRTVYASVDENDTGHWPLDQWTTVTKHPLYAAPVAAQAEQVYESGCYTPRPPAEQGERKSVQDDICNACPDAYACMYKCRCKLNDVPMRKLLRLAAPAAPAEQGERKS